MAFILSIDQSTSATKAVLIDKGANLVHRCTKEHKQYYPEKGWVEHDPEEIYTNTVYLIKQLIEESGVSKSQISGLAITNQRETVVAWDKKSGKPVYNAIVWQCQRGADICSQWKEEGLETKIKSKTGLIIDPYFSASGVKWIIDNVKGLDKQNLAFGTMDSWLLFRLTGGKVHVTDYSNACRTMLFNIYDLEWDRELLDLVGVNSGMCPSVRYADEIVGHSTVEGFFDHEIPVAGLLGDSHAALVGQQCFDTGLGKATYGTGSSVMMNIGKSPLKCPEGLVTSIGYGAGNEIDYVFEGNIHCTGDTIKWLVDGLQLIEDSRSSEQYALSVKDNNGVYFVPAFVGLGAPYWNNGARALVCGMSRDTRKEHVVRAALESIAYQVKDLVDLMTDDAGIALKELRVDGGPTRNKFLMQFQANMLNANINCSEIEEASALGSALMAGLAVGLWSGLDEVRSLKKDGMVFTTEMGDIQRNILYNGWKKAVSKTLYET